MYEIPQQLEYKEKIVFGLTFGQIMDAFIFISISIIILKTKIPIQIKVFTISIFISLAIGFMFFDFFSKIKNWYWWYKFREIDDPKKLKHIFGAKIKNNLIIK